MSRSTTIVRSVWKFWAYFCGVIGLLVVCLVVYVTLQQSRNEHAFVQSHLLPLVQFVASFRESHHRLPTDDEFQKWASKSDTMIGAQYFSKQPSFMKDWGVADRDFIVGAWRGEWMEYYRSWDKAVFEDYTPNTALEPTATAPSVSIKQ
jgi:hypothetical protein